MVHFIYRERSLACLTMNKEGYKIITRGWVQKQQQKSWHEKHLRNK